MLARFLLILSTLSLIACGKDDPSFSLLPESNVFQSTSSFNNKLDILWVIDNSGSMAPYQQNVADNFAAFIQDFQTKGFDYRIAVITTDAWQADFSSTYNWKAGFRSNAGTALITPETPNIEDAFLDNILQGTGGYGDERAFQSFEVALNHPSNAAYDFPRSDAFLAVIIVSDEDDFSHSTSSVTPHLERDYDYPDLYSISYYTDFLDNITGSSELSVKKYNVSAIAVTNTTCLNDPSTHFDAIIGLRYLDLVDAANGIDGSICDTNFSNNLNQIQTKISELSTQFILTRTPVDGSIEVLINGSLIPEDAVNGWTYDPIANSVVFHGSATPAEGDSIIVNYDPTGLEL